MKTYQSGEFKLMPSTDVVYDKTNIETKLNELNKSLLKKFKHSAEKEYQNMKAAQSFVTTI